MSQMKRRDFLKVSTLTATHGLFMADFARLFAMIGGGLIQNANAQIQQAPILNYLNIHLSGGPSRWAFDQWLRPNENDPILSPANASTWNPGIGTAFNNGNFEYKTFLHKGHNVPHLFNFDVRKHGGGVRPLKDLLDHMVIIRGFSSGSDGHELNSGIQIYPDSASPSINGAVADLRKDSLAAVRIPGGVAPFNSKTGKAQSVITDESGGAINGLMKNFKKFTAINRGVKDLSELKGLKEEFLAMMKQIAGESDHAKKALYDQIDGAKSLIDFAAEDLTGIFNTLNTKYRTVITDSARISDGSFANIPGITDAPVFFGATEDTRVGNATTKISRTYDLRECFLRSDYLTDASLSRTFAVAEYCLTRGISGSLAGGGGTTCSNLQFLPDGGSTLSKINVGHDQHELGFRLGLLINHSYWRGFGAGLLTLIDTLKNTTLNGDNLFNQTVIHVAGDFSRTPRNDMRGFDHGWSAQVASVFTGKINGPHVIGNIKPTGLNGYSGTWGLGAEVDFNGAKETLSPRHVAAALSHLLNINPNPWNFTNLVWKVENGILVPKIGAKTI